MGENAPGATGRKKRGQHVISSEEREREREREREMPIGY